MPITQERVLSILAAGEDYQQALERYWVIAQSTRQRVASGQITPQQGFDLLAIETQPQWLLKFPYDSPAVLRLEHLHFKREAKRNNKKAEKARANRDADAKGIPRPNRGNGKEFGILGGGRTRLDQPLNLVPDAGILLQSKIAPPQPEASLHHTKIQRENTDHLQVNTDTELDLGMDKISRVGDFLSNLDENGNVKK